MFPNDRVETKSNAIHHFWRNVLDRREGLRRSLARDAACYLPNPDNSMNSARVYALGSVQAFANKGSTVGAWSEWVEAARVTAAQRLGV